MKINILTIFPEAFSSLRVGILGRSLGKIWHLNIVDMRVVKNIDARPAGGGPGMLITCDTIEYFENFLSTNPIFVSPDGPVFHQAQAEQLSSQKEITFLCGRYEGVDQRALNYYNFQKISLGDFILAGGEIAVCAIVESIVRLLPGAMNNNTSTEQESFSNFLLEHDQYTKPVSWKNLDIPPVLLSGHHHRQSLWKLHNSLLKTHNIRIDLYNKFLFTILRLLFIQSLINNK